MTPRKFALQSSGPINAPNFPGLTFDALKIRAARAGMRVSHKQIDLALGDAQRWREGSRATLKSSTIAERLAITADERRNLELWHIAPKSLEQVAEKRERERERSRARRRAKGIAPVDHSASALAKAEGVTVSAIRKRAARAAPLPHNGPG
jgi:hypothetical protein